jgi:hypothetical protein
LRRRLRYRSAGGISAAMNITGTTVFVPVDITDEDWDVILRDLAIGPPTEAEWDAILRGLAVTLT